MGIIIIIFGPMGHHRMGGERGGVVNVVGRWTWCTVWQKSCGNLHSGIVTYLQACTQPKTKGKLLLLLLLI